MAVDYRKQYTPEQLEPFWPNEIIRMAIVSLCTLAVITVVSVLPVVLDYWGLTRWVEISEPADPRATPVDIRPEWYFLAVYQYLKLPPLEILGISGKTIGVLSMAMFMVAVMLLPFWDRRRPDRPPGVLHCFLVTLVIGVLLLLTFQAAWPPPALLTIAFGAAVILFYMLLANERRRIRRVLPRRRDSTR